MHANSKRPSKLSGAWARQAAWRKVLEHVALGHRVVQHKSPPLVSFTLLPAAPLLLPVTAAASPPMSMEAMSLSPAPFGKLSPPPAFRSPRVEAQVVPVIQDYSWQYHSYLQTRFGSRVQDVYYVPFDKEAVALCSTACCEE